MESFLTLVDESILFVNTKIYPYSKHTVFMQSDFVDDQVQSLAIHSGLDVSQLKFVLSLFFVYLLSIIYRQIPSYTMRLWFHLIVGVWLLQVKNEVILWWVGDDGGYDNKCHLYHLISLLWVSFVWERSGFMG